jgi:hypothetical protein
VLPAIGVEATAPSTAGPDANIPRISTADHQSTATAEESKVINFLINQYLQAKGHKMAALAFADENDEQDLENWEEIYGVPKDVLPPPANLWTLYRNWRFHGTKQPSFYLPTISASPVAEKLPTEGAEAVIDEKLGLSSQDVSTSRSVRVVRDKLNLAGR